MKFISKITALFLALLMVLSPMAALPLSVEGFAAEELVLKTDVSAQEFALGDVITVTVSLNGTVSTRSFGLELVTAYDHEAFEWVSGDWNQSIKSASIMSPVDVEKGKATFAAMSAFDVTGEVFSFQIKATGVTTCADVFEIKVVPNDKLPAVAEGTTISLAHTYDNTCDAECNVCGNVRTIQHVYDNLGDADCNLCGAVRELPNYVYAVHRGDLVTVSVEILNEKPISTRGFGLDLRDAYDHDVFEWVDGDWSKAITASAILADVHDGQDAVFACMEAIEISDEIFTFVLKVKDTADFGDYDVKTSLSGCDEAQLATIAITVHECAATEALASDEEGHWNVCATYACTAQLNKAEHVYDNACDTDCNVCGEVRTITHDYSVQDKDTENHWMKCSVCGTIDEATRAAHVHDHACDTDCNVCGEVRTITHDYSVQDKDTENHWMKCSVCGAIDETTRAPHVHDHACDTDCNVCGEVRTITHDYSVQDKDAENHWMKCSVCGAIDEATRAPHVHDNACDTDCNVCGEIRTVPHDFTIVEKDETNHWNKCTICGLINETSRVPHGYDNACDDTCDVCGQTRQVPDHVYDDHTDLFCNECGYERPPYVVGDVDGNNEVNMDDAIYLLFHTSFSDDYPLNQPADFDNSGEVNMDDAIYLLFHTSFPADYPLYSAPAKPATPAVAQMDGVWVAEYYFGQGFYQVALTLSGEELIVAVAEGTPLDLLPTDFQESIRGKEEEGYYRYDTGNGWDEIYFGSGDGDGLASVSEKGETVTVTDLQGKSLVLTRTAENQLTMKGDYLYDFGGFVTIPSETVFNFVPAE